MDKNEYISENFQYKEFFCYGIEPPQIYFDNIFKLAHCLQKVRDAVNRPIIINSGWRTKEHNAAVGGASSSQHLIGKAADIRIKGLSVKFANIYLAKYGNFNGFGIAGSYTHVDIRDVVNNRIVVWTY